MSSSLAERPGKGFMIAIPDAGTRDEMAAKKLLGLPTIHLGKLLSLRADEVLFAFDEDARLVYGPFEPVGRAGKDLDPAAFRGRELRAQVRFNLVGCTPRAVEFSDLSFAPVIGPLQPHAKQQLSQLFDALPAYFRGLGLQHVTPEFQAEEMDLAAIQYCRTDEEMLDGIKSALPEDRPYFTLIRQSLRGEAPLAYPDSASKGPFPRRIVTWPVATSASEPLTSFGAWGLQSPTARAARSPETNAAVAAARPPKPCRNFEAGNCRFGHRCRFAHPLNESPAAAVGAASVLVPAVARAAMRPGISARERAQDGPESLVTSALRPSAEYTVVSTDHARERKQERAVPTEVTQRTLKRGSWAPEREGRFKVVFEDCCIIVAPNRKTIITAYWIHALTFYKAVAPTQLLRFDWKAETEALGSVPVVVGSAAYFNTSDRASRLINAVVPASAECLSHVVMVVDSSGSMRKSDCATSTKGATMKRISAVFQCLANDFARVQARQKGCERNAATLIEMTNGKARVVFERQPLTSNFVEDLSYFALNHSSPQGDACYLSALEAVQELTRPDTREDYAVVICFLSDGVPSDRLSYTEESLVEYGVDAESVAELLGMSEDAPQRGKGRGLHGKATAVYSAVFGNKMQLLLRTIGPSRFRLITVGFGERVEDFGILKSLAASVNGRFAHATLADAELSKIFRTLSSTLTETRTFTSKLQEEKAGKLRTLRTIERSKASSAARIKVFMSMGPSLAEEEDDDSSDEEQAKPGSTLTEGLGVGLGVQRIIEEEDEEEDDDEEDAFQVLNDAGDFDDPQEKLAFAEDPAAETSVVPDFSSGWGESEVADQPISPFPAEVQDELEEEPQPTLVNELEEEAQAEQRNYDVCKAAVAEAEVMLKRLGKGARSALLETKRRLIVERTANCYQAGAKTAQERARQRNVLRELIRDLDVKQNTTSMSLFAENELLNKISKHKLIQKELTKFDSKLDIIDEELAALELATASGFTRDGASAHLKECEYTMELAEAHLYDEVLNDLQEAKEDFAERHSLWATRKLKQERQNETALSPASPTSPLSSASEAGSVTMKKVAKYSCPLCNVGCASFDEWVSHAQGKKHLKKLGKLPVSSLDLFKVLSAKGLGAFWSDFGCHHVTAQLFKVLDDSTLEAMLVGAGKMKANEFKFLLPDFQMAQAALIEPSLSKYDTYKKFVLGNLRSRKGESDKGKSDFFGEEAEDATGDGWIVPGAKFQLDGLEQAGKKLNGEPGEIVEILPSGRVSVQVGYNKYSIQKNNLKRLDERKKGAPANEAAEEDGWTGAAAGYLSRITNSAKEVLESVRSRLETERDPQARAKLLDQQKKHEALLVRKKESDSLGKDWVGIEYTGNVVLSKESFGEGAERVVFDVKLEYRLKKSKKKKADKKDPIVTEILAAKESRFEEDLKDPYSWHKTFAETQMTAFEFANEFNIAVNARMDGGCRLEFIEPRLVLVQDANKTKYANGRRCILVEPRLDTGQYPWRKWNSNAGHVWEHPESDFTLGGPGDRGGGGGVYGRLATQQGSGGSKRSGVKYADFLQAYSHYTYEYSNGDLLVCDIQGTFVHDHRTSARDKDFDGVSKRLPTFRLTDPVIHDASRAKARAAEDGWGMRSHKEVSQEAASEHKRRGRTDRRQQGIADFFLSHKCNGVCRALELQQGAEVYQEVKRELGEDSDGEDEDGEGSGGRGRGPAEAKGAAPSPSAQSSRNPRRRSKSRSARSRSRSQAGRR